MVARFTSIVSGIVLGWLAASSLQAEEPLASAAKSAGTIQVASALPASSATTTVVTTAGTTRITTTNSGTMKASSASFIPAVAPVRTTVTSTVRQQDAQQPALTPSSQPFQPDSKSPAAASQLSSKVFGSSGVSTSQLAQNRRDRASATSSDVVLGGNEARYRATSDAGSLLGKSNQTRGVSSQMRSPIITDTRIRGAGVGNVVVGG